MYCFEPYKSCSLFGVLRYFSNIKNAVLLIHGPSGCAFFNRNGIIRLNGYYSAPYKISIPKIFCTGFDENDAIFGGEEKVRKAALELIDKFSPRVLFILNCCVSEITGENIDDIAIELMQMKPDTITVPVHSAGFKGDHRVGMHMAADILYERFMRVDSKDEVDVNIIGDFDYFNNTTAELVEELHRIGINRILQIPGNCTVEDLANATNAKLNLIACGFAGMRLAKKMQENDDIPYIGSGIDLYGVEKCFSYYSKLYDFFEKDKTLLVQRYQEAKKELAQYVLSLKGKRAYIVAGMRRTVGYAEILQELGVKIEFIFTERDEQNFSQEIMTRYSDRIMCNDPAFELYDIVEQGKPDFILSTLSELIAPHAYITRTDEDFAGFNGAIRMAKYLIEKMRAGESLYIAIPN